MQNKMHDATRHDPKKMTTPEQAGSAAGVAGSGSSVGGAQSGEGGAQSEVGNDCAAGANCNPIPQGVAALADLLWTWLRESVPLEASERDARLAQWLKAPAARAAHPREEHLLPLMVVAGAAGADRGRVAYRGSMRGLDISGYDFRAA